VTKQKTSNSIWGRSFSDTSIDGNTHGRLRQIFVPVLGVVACGTLKTSKKVNEYTNLYLPTAPIGPKIAVRRHDQTTRVRRHAMKRTTILICVLGVLGLPGLVLGGTLRIGYLDVSRVAEESPQYQAARESLQTELKRREADLRRLADQLQGREERLRRNNSVMSASKVSELEREILSLRRKLQNSREEHRDELSLRQNEERTKLLRQVTEVVKAIGKEERFDLILTEGVAYASTDVDISDRVLQRLKRSFKRR
jgi:outer membrane protein